MHHEDLKPHIIEVNENIINLGKDVFDRDRITPLRTVFKGDQGRYSTKPYESEPVLPKAKPRKRIPIPRELIKPKLTEVPVVTKRLYERNIKREPLTSGIKKLDTYSKPTQIVPTISNSTITPARKPQNLGIIRNKPILRSKIPNIRTATADPRFRRSRTPVAKNRFLATQSDSKVSPTNSERRTSKVHSESKFLLTSKSDAISTTTSRMQIGDSKGDSAPPTIIKLTQRLEYTHSILAEKSETLSSKISNDERDATVDDPTVTDSISLVAGTLYQSAVSGPFLRKHDLRSRPCWDDPRLIDKYGKLLKPVTLGPRNSLSSWTLPVEKPDQDKDFSGDCQRCDLSKSESQRQFIRHTCTKCVSTMDIGTLFSEHTLKTFTPYKSTRRNLFGLIFKNYLLALFFVIGSIFGLLLIALIVWIVANDMSWNFWTKTTPTPKPSGLYSWVMYICGGAIYGISYVCKKIGYMFVMPRSEVYDSGKVDMSDPWYWFLISWI